MNHRFISWLYFPFDKEVQDYELLIIKDVIQEINLKYCEIDLKSPEINPKEFNYNYLINENNYSTLLNQQNSNLLIIHRPDKYIYSFFPYALANIVRYIDEKNNSFEEIKGLNTMDLILVSDSEIKKNLERKHINPEKIIVLPLPNNDNQFFKENIKKIFNGIFEKYYTSLQLFESRDNNLSNKFKIRQLIEQLSTNSFIFLEGLEESEDDKIINQLNNLAKKYEYIIISCKSEIYSPKNKSKEYFLDLLNEFNVIQETYYGNPELKFYEKEMFLIVIKNSSTKMDKKYITWEGTQFLHNSLAVINRELELKIIESDNYELSIIPQDYYQEINSNNYPFYNLLKEHFNRILLKKNDIYIRHVLPSGFNSPEDGHYVLIFPWEYGKIPAKLLEHINLEVDQVWCPSNYVKNMHIENGIIESKLRVIPNGINPKIFSPGLIPIKLNTNKSFRFLFLGGILYRKGIDILLDAYTEEFNNDEDVCLVIKGLGQESYYEANSITQKIKQVVNDKTNPEVILIEKNFKIEEMGSVYTSCNCYVHPYRGEGFCMPIAEAMSCDLPVIVPRYGPSLDFCDNSNSYLTDYKLKQIYDNELHEMVTVCEVNKEHLKKQMRYIFENYPESKKIGNNASKVINKLSWDHIFKLIEKEINLLIEQPIFRKNREYYTDEIVNAINKNIENNKFTNLNSYAHNLEQLDKENFHLETRGDAYYYSQNYKKALEHFSKLIKTNNGSKLRNKLADTLEKLGDKKTADSLRNIRN